MASKYKLTPGKEFADIERILNELSDKLTSKDNQTGSLKTYQTLGIVKKTDGSFALQVRNADGTVLETSNTTATGLKVI